MVAWYSCVLEGCFKLASSLLHCMQEENVKQWDKEEVKVTSQLARLQSERNVLAQRLVEAEASLTQQREGWQKERNKTMTLTYSEYSI